MKPNGMLALLLCSAAVVLGAVRLSAREQQSPTGITITSHTNLVLVPAVVEDSSGKHIAGLAKDNFEIVENGKSKAISTFEEVKTTSRRLERTPNQRGVYSNELRGDSSPKRLTIFALDTVNTPFLDQTYARQQLVKFLANRISSQEPCALISIQGNGIRILHDFSDDPAQLVAALKRASGEIPELRISAGAGPSDSILDFVNGADLGYAVLAQRNAILTTLESFQHVAEAFAGVPGRKSLVWATASFPFGLDPTTGTLLSPTVFNKGQAVFANTMDSTGGLPELPSSTQIRANDDLRPLAPVYERTIQMLNDANIALYPVDARGLVTFFPDASTSRMTRLESFNEALFESSRQTMVGFAEMTGGKAFYNRNDLDVAFGKAADDSESYYMLGYYLEKNAKPGWHKLQVKLKQGGHVRARNGFFVTAESRQADTRRMDIKMALASPLDYTGLPLLVSWTGAQPAGAKKKVSFQVTLPPSAGVVDETDHNHLSLEVVASARNVNGSPADQFAEHVEANLKPESIAALRKDGVNYNSNLQVAPGEYSVRIVVRDNLTGRLGSVRAPLRVAP
jgi:VWFA-related protein